MIFLRLGWGATLKGAPCRTQTQPRPRAWAVVRSASGLLCKILSEKDTYHGPGYLPITRKGNAGRVHTALVRLPFPRKSASGSTNLPPNEGESLEAQGQS